MIKLVPITPENYQEASKLSVNEDQKHLVASVEKSLADAYVYTASEFRLIAADEQIVGYALLFPYEKNGLHCVNIVRFMIDAGSQGNGFGRGALQAVFSELNTWIPRVELVRISTLPENEIALNLYRSVGFIDRGIEQGEVALYRETAGA